MVSTLASSKLSSTTKNVYFDFDPGVTSLVDVGWESMQDFGAILVGVFRTIGTGTLVLNLLSNTVADGSGTDTTRKNKTFTAGQPDAVGDYVFVEAIASELGGDPGVCAQISTTTGTDELVVHYQFGLARFGQLDLSADSIA